MKIFMMMVLLMYTATSVADDKTNCTNPSQHEQVKHVISTKPLPQEITLDCGSHVSNQSVNGKSESEPKTPDHTALWAAVISAAAAILGVAVTAIFSYFVAKRNADAQQSIEEKRLRVNIVTTERLRWLQDIRQRLSQLYRQMDMQYNHLKRPVPQDQSAQFQQTLDTLSAEIMEQSNVITLMLNPNKSEQATLRYALQQAMSFLSECFVQKGNGATSFNDPGYASIKQVAFDALTSIGIQTWDRIQKLE